MRVLIWFIVLLQATAAAYLAALTAVAVFTTRQSASWTSQRPLRLAVVIPAHDEEKMLPRLLSSLALQTFPADRVTIHVIADNCGDRTAEVAHAFGAQVHVRNNLELPGKGRALAWLLPRLAGDPADAFVFLDADSTVEPQFLEVMATHLEQGKRALQASYRVADADSSSLVALRAVAFTLMHDVRGRAKSRLGVSCGLWGNGMALHREVLRDADWESFSSVEDAEQHLRLIVSGVKVTFVPEARVYGFMPSNYADAAGQQERWEAGRLSLLRTWWRPLLGYAATRHSGSAAVALCDLALPPLSVVGMMNLLALIPALTLGTKGVRVVALASTAGLVVHVLVGLVIAGLRPHSYLALAEAPRFVLWKLWLYLRQVMRRADSAWVRTPRPTLARREGAYPIWVAWDRTGPCTGRQTLKQVPDPEAGSIHTLPPCASARQRTMYSPRP